MYLVFHRAPQSHVNQIDQVDHKNKVLFHMTVGDKNKEARDVALWKDTYRLKLSLQADINMYFKVCSGT